ncbi:MAG: DJ-1/PfpI family protein [Treponema sp.]|nr:DJ-1/PfpI family protein [Treponema sp.]
MSMNALVFLADGFEEVEAATPIDYLRRAGITVTTASVSGSTAVTGARSLPVIADSLITEITERPVWDIILCPGGMPGAANIAASPAACSLLKAQAEGGRWIAAICASPAVILAPLGILQGRRFTCYPGMEALVSGAIWSADSVVIDGNIITSRGPGTAGRFAAAIIAQLLSQKDADKLAESVLLQ